MRSEVRGKAQTDPLGQLFRQLDERSFQGEAEFQRAVADRFNSCLDAFPPHYSYRDAITAGVRKGWISTDGATVRVHLSGAPAVALHPVALAA